MTWYVAKVETNKEYRAEDAGKRFGVVVFVPMIAQKFTSGGRALVRPVLMFPGYAFVQFDSMGVWKRARRESFVFLGLLGSGDFKVEGLADIVVEELKERHVDGVVPLVEHRVKFEVDQKVRIARGKYADVSGLIQSTSVGRVAVLTRMFNQEMVVDLDESLVVAA